MRSGTGSVASSRLRLAAIALICDWTVPGGIQYVGVACQRLQALVGRKTLFCQATRLGPVLNVLQELVASTEDAH